MLAVPLPSRSGEVLGVVVLHTIAPREFDVSALDFIVHTASLLAGAIENAQVYEQAKRRVDALTTLTELSQRIAAATGRDDVQRAVTAGARGLLGTEAAHLYRLDPEREELSWPPPTRPARPRRSRSWRARALFADVLRRDGHLVAPLVASGEQLGCLCALPRRSRPFTIEEDGLFRAVADQAAVALKKAELIERLTAENVVRDVFEALETGAVEVAEDGEGGRLGPRPAARRPPRHARRRPGSRTRVRRALRRHARRHPARRRCGRSCRSRTARRRPASTSCAPRAASSPRTPGRSSASAAPPGARARACARCARPPTRRASGARCGAPASRCATTSSAPTATSCTSTSTSAPHDRYWEGGRDPARLRRAPAHPPRRHAGAVPPRRAQRRRDGTGAVHPPQHRAPAARARGNAVGAVDRGRRPALARAGDQARAPGPGDRRPRSSARPSCGG